MAGSAALWWWPREPTFRKVGLALQLLGVGTVALGIRDTRKRFKQPGYLRRFAAWIWDLPVRWPWRRRDAIAHATGAMSITGSASGRAWSSAAPGSDLAARVLALENNTASLQATVAEGQAELRKGLDTTAAEVASEVQTRTTQFTEMYRLLTALHVGGLDISVVGLVWLAVGLILATVFVELNECLFEAGKTCGLP